MSNTDILLQEQVKADTKVAETKGKPWKGYQRIAFRVAFIFFILISIPTDARWYKNAFTIDWTRPHYRDIYDLARFSPNYSQFFGSKKNFEEAGSNAGGAKDDGASAKKKKDAVQQAKADNKAPAAEAPGKKKNFLADYSEWGFIFLIAFAGGLIWTALDRKRKEYNILYYWVRVVVRYRAGIGIIGFGFTKLFPTQMPYPSLGLLNTDFGDFTTQKIYWLSVGIVPWYQVFGGIVEVVAGALLFFRKTTAYGAILLIAALGDITVVNYAYDGGVHVYAFYFVLLSAFLLAEDIPKLYDLLIRERNVQLVRYYPNLSSGWPRYTRIALKSLVFIIFLGVLTYTEVINFKYDPYKQPSTAGIPQLRGNYNVTEFRVNNKVIPYSPFDSVRWQQATFEKWTTLTFKVNKPVVLDLSNGGGSQMRDIERTFEITGTAGGQRAFHYYADTVDNVLYLQDKNAAASRNSGRLGRNADWNVEKSAQNKKEEEDNWISQAAWKHIGNERDFIDKRAWSTRRDREFAEKPRSVKRARMVLNYQTNDGARVILTGINENRDSIYVVLDRVNRKYVLPVSTLDAGKY